MAMAVAMAIAMAVKVADAERMYSLNMRGGGRRNIRCPPTHTDASAAAKMFCVSAGVRGRRIFRRRDAPPECSAWRTPAGCTC